MIDSQPSPIDLTEADLHDARIGAIMDSEDAAFASDIALYLAYETDLSVETALHILKVATADIPRRAPADFAAEWAALNPKIKLWSGRGH